MEGTPPTTDTDCSGGAIARPVCQEWLCCPRGALWGVSPPQPSSLLLTPLLRLLPRSPHCVALGSHLQEGRDEESWGRGVQRADTGRPQGYSLAGIQPLAASAMDDFTCHPPPPSHHPTYSETPAGNLYLSVQALCWESQEGPTAFRTPLPSPHHSLQKGAANRGGFSL